MGVTISDKLRVDKKTAFKVKAFILVQVSKNLEAVSGDLILTK